MRKATILGGPLDGKVVDCVGPTLRTPRLRPINFSRGTEPVPEPVRCNTYQLHRDDDGRWWYVLQR